MSTSSDWAYPENVVRIMRPQILNAQLAFRAHYARRHTHGSRAARNWLAEIRRIDRSSGYSRALALVGSGL